MSEVDGSKWAVQLGRRARAASRGLATAAGRQKQDWLKRLAGGLVAAEASILAANQLDVAEAGAAGLTPAAIDRLTLASARIQAIADALGDVAGLPDPVGQVIGSNVRPNGLVADKIRVPLGVVFFIFESRPNVTIDAASLCVKSGNAVILRVEKEALRTNVALYAVIRETLAAAGLPADSVQLVETADRALVGELLKRDDLINVTIPRGGKSLIERVTAEARMPVMKHFDGICHVYVDQSADLESATRIIVNAKCQRPGVCNAAESLLVHRDVAERFLPSAAAALASAGCELRGCSRTRALVPSAKAATEADYRTEFLAKILAVKVVDSLDEAIQHIDENGSHHTDAIVTADLRAARRFAAEVDSAAVMINASTRFNDGGELGLGAEIGISTDKYHARGPCGLEELTTYKYVVFGDGQIRE